MSNTQSVKAVAKYIRMSPHKVRRVLNQIRGRSYQEALMILEFLPYMGSRWPRMASRTFCCS
jgi:large subunit ribosomal protein L22